MQKRILSKTKNKAEIAKTMTLLMDQKNEIPDYIQIALIKMLLWMSTEYNDEGKSDKYIGVEYWSTGALRQTIINSYNNTFYYKDLRHEHSIPKVFIEDKIEELYEKAIATKDNILNLLNNYSHATIVNKDEDTVINKHGLRSKMPKNWDGNDFLARYKEAGIAVAKITDEVASKIEKGTLTEADIEALFTTRKAC